MNFNKCHLNDGYKKRKTYKWKCDPHDISIFIGEVNDTPKSILIQSKSKMFKIIEIRNKNYNKEKDKNQDLQAGQYNIRT